MSFKSLGPNRGATSNFPSNPTTSASAQIPTAVAAAFSIDEMMGYASNAFRTPSYHELLDNPHVEVDGLQRLRDNLSALEDLHGRLRFMLRDVSGLIRRR